MIKVTEVTLAAIIEMVSTIVTGAVGWMSTLLGAITASPVLSIFCIGVPLLSIGVITLRSLMGTRG